MSAPTWLGWMWAASFLWMLVAGIVCWLAFFDHQNLIHTTWDIPLQFLCISLISLGAVNLILWMIHHPASTSAHTQA